MDWIENKYHCGPVVIIGVHSPKFNNGQEANNIKEAISWYKMNHLIIVDRNMAIWQTNNIVGWPTLVVIDPKGKAVYQQSDEGQLEYLDDIISICLVSMRN